MRTMFRTSFPLATVAMAWVALASTAHATASPSTLLSNDPLCLQWTSEAGSPGNVTVTGEVGDTFSVKFTGISCPGATWSGASGILTAASGSSPYGITTTLTIAGSGTVTFTTAGFPSPTVTIVATSPATPTSQSNGVPAGPPDHLQQLPMPQSGSCADIDDTGLGWGTGLAGHWTPQWGNWANAMVCGRTFRYDTTHAVWTVIT